MFPSFPYASLFRNMFITPRHRRLGKAMENTPTVESLEARNLLTSFLVTTLDDVVADDGQLSLREAIEASNQNNAFSDAPAGEENGDTISFAPDLAGDKIMQKLGQYKITDDVTITGSVANRITIDSSDIFARAFVISTNESVSLSNLELTGSRTNRNGGAMVIAGGGDVTLTNMDINNNTARKSGGGIYIAKSGGNQRVTIVDSTISNNLAKAMINFNSQSTDWYSFGGGGIYNKANHLTIIGSTFEDNITGRSFQGRPIFVASIGLGGGIHNNAGRAEIRETTFSGNDTAVSGGAIFNSNGGIIELTDSQLSGNFASSGGAVHNEGILRSSHTEFTNNTANQGGGIYSRTGEVSLSNSVVSGNKASSDGGGIAVTGGKLKLESTDILNNSIELIETSFNSISPNPGKGGGIWIKTGRNKATVTVEIIGGTIAGNNSTNITHRECLSCGVLGINPTFTVGGTGGGIYNEDGIITISGGAVIRENAAYLGGGIYNLNGTISIEGTGHESVLIENNEGFWAGGGIYNYSRLSIENAVITGNKSEEIGQYGHRGNGGGIYSLGSLMIKNSTISDNHASNNGGGIFLGGGTTLGNSNIWIDNFFSSRERLPEDGEATISNSIVQNNSAKNGGGIYHAIGNLTIEGTSENPVLISNNTAFEDGGGIYNSGFGSLNISHAIIEGNSARRNGGGIADYASEAYTTSLNNVAISNNTAGRTLLTISPSPLTIDPPLESDLYTILVIGTTHSHGGGIYFGGEGTLEITQSQITENSANTYGGGIYNDSGTVNITETTIAHNEAFANDINWALEARSYSTSNPQKTSKAGGGIYNTSGNVTLKNSEVTGNTAHGDGGGIFSAGGSIMLDHSVVNNNTIVAEGESTASKFWTGNGGGVAITQGRFYAMDSQINNNVVENGNGGGFWGNGKNSPWLPAQNDFEAIFIRTTISGNSASEQGGGMWTSGGDTILDRSQVIDNTANGENERAGGGGIYNEIGKLILHHSILQRNTALGNTGNGGGIYNAAEGEIDVRRNSFVLRNRAGQSGGGIYNAGKAKVEQSRVMGNRAQEKAGAIYNDEQATLEVIESIFGGGNRARFARGIYNAGDLTVTDTRVSVRNA